MGVFETTGHYFRFFANEAIRGGSPLYEDLALGIAKAPALQAMALQRKHGQPPANLIFGAVHYLLLGGADHSLKDYYPSVGGKKPVDEQAFPLFADFCSDYKEQLLEIISQRATNTNEVGRSSLLAPGFDLIARISKKPLGIVEIGCSAGLNLNFDRYGYRYTSEHGAVKLERWTEASLRLSCVLEGPITPVMADCPPAITSRVGLELYPTDIGDENERRWLKALVWPERTDRLANLAAALEVAVASPPPIIGGDAVFNLAAALAEIPAHCSACVYHTVMMYQLSRDQVVEIEKILLEASTDLPVWRLSMESVISDPSNPTATFNPLRLSRYFGGKKKTVALAICDPHGFCMEWKQH